VTFEDVSWPQRTERLVLRRVRPGDIERLLEFRNKPEVSRWLLRTEIGAEALRAAWLGSLTEPRNLSSVAELDGVVIGTATLEVRDGLGQNDDEAMTGAEAEIGYVLDPAYAGRGFATEIAEALLRIAFEDAGVRRVTAGCYADNAGSVRVLEKAGMRREQYGVQDSWHAELGWVDGCTYALLAEEWVKASAARGR